MHFAQWTNRQPYVSFLSFDKTSYYTRSLNPFSRVKQNGCIHGMFRGKTRGKERGKRHGK